MDNKWDSNQWANNRWDNNQWVNNKWDNNQWVNNKWVKHLWANNKCNNLIWVSKTWDSNKCLNKTMVRCNSQTWANNRCNNQIWDNKWDITKWDKTNQIFLRCSSLLFQVTMIAIRIQVYLTFYQMGLQDICSRLVRKVKLDVFKVELKEENHPLLLIITMVNQVVRLWEKKL